MVDHLAGRALRALYRGAPGLGAAVLLLPLHAQAAASGLYDMDRLLHEPYPLAAPTPAAPPAPPPKRATTAPPPPPAAAPAAGPAPTAVEVNDPLEPVNRGIFAFNEFFRKWILGPVSGAYVRFVPDPVRRSVGNILDNIESPTILANDLLQAEFKRAWDTTRRVVINTTVGVGGTFDIAAHLGIPKHSEDLGQTFAVWGIGEGPYLVLPLFGPSNPRDAIGGAVDGYFHPLSRWASNTGREEINYGIGSAKAVHEYSLVMDDLDKMRKTSVDFYAALRSTYRQKRNVEIRNGRAISVPDLDYNLK